uniref:Uncharacterized protein n=1 Tax=Caenorhabditis tropicalis TaxID=1561998 RepID=A0A1I7TNT5_9PELO
MIRVDDSNLESHEEDAPPPPPPPPPPTTSSNHVRLTGSGLPGGEQQQGTSTEIAVATADNNRPTGQLALPSSSSMTTSLATTSNNQYTIPLDENEHKYVGLVNQVWNRFFSTLRSYFPPRKNHFSQAKALFSP